MQNFQDYTDSTVAGVMEFVFNQEPPPSTGFCYEADTRYVSLLELNKIRKAATNS